MSKRNHLPAFSPFDRVVFWALGVIALAATCFLACWAVFYGIAWLMYAGTVDPWARDWAIAVVSA